MSRSPAHVIAVVGALAVVFVLAVRWLVRREEARQFTIVMVTITVDASAAIAAFRELGKSIEDFGRALARAVDR
jgi:hypothetical protein